MYAAFMQPNWEDRVHNEEVLSVDLTGILRIATDDKSTKYKSRKEKRLASLIANNNYSSEPSVRLVAGEGFEPPTFGLWARRAARLLHPATEEANVTVGDGFTQALSKLLIPL